MSLLINMTGTYLLADKVSCLAELSMKKSFITSGPVQITLQLFLDLWVYSSLSKVIHSKIILYT